MRRRKSPQLSDCPKGNQLTESPTCSVNWPQRSLSHLGAWCPHLSSERDFIDTLCTPVQFENSVILSQVRSIYTKLKAGMSARPCRGKPEGRPGSRAPPQ